ncbi:hypothetical protein EGR_00278 [Echinococcus granulosus]|uniref:Uncharacterized protein n=1 Tax=Echinococcus granulosus TaxID=6210 RepID=W6VDZ7_ECHGR|nr:hypothetical protein EGR_00278 [Echinococcus granulosus]EUB65009.1 hypothetical protein EGR_00278 [Echinococcus granulosus]
MIKEQLEFCKEFSSQEHKPHFDVVVIGQEDHECLRFEVGVSNRNTVQLRLTCGKLIICLDFEYNLVGKFHPHNVENHRRMSGIGPYAQKQIPQIKRKNLFLGKDFKNSTIEAIWRMKQEMSLCQELQPLKRAKGSGINTKKSTNHTGGRQIDEQKRVFLGCASPDKLN